MFKGPWGRRTRAMADDPLAGALGSLERQVMDVMWTAGSLLVRDVQDRLQRPIAYTTVMTTLDRLYKKGFVDRVRQGRAFAYTSARTRDEVQAALAAGVLSGVLAGGGRAVLPVLSNLVEAVGDDEALLDRLDALVQEQRRRIQERSR